MEKIQKSINKDLEELKNKHTETNNTITEIKNTLEGINGRISAAEERISELEDKMVEITSEEQNKVKGMKRTEDSLRDLCSVQFSSVAQSCPTLCKPMNRSTPGLPVHHQLPEFTKTHVHRVHDAILILMPSPPAPNPSQHQSLSQ